MKWPHSLILSIVTANIISATYQHTQEKSLGSHR